MSPLYFDTACCIIRDDGAITTRHKKNQLSWDEFSKNKTLQQCLSWKMHPYSYFLCPCGKEKTKQVQFKYSLQLFARTKAACSITTASLLRDTKMCSVVCCLSQA